MRKPHVTGAILLGVAGFFVAQNLDAQTSSQLSLEAQRAEIEQVQARLSFLVRDVIRENPDFLEQRAEYSAALDRAVDEVLPSAPTHRARLAELQEAHDALLQEGDREAMDRLFEKGKEHAEALWQARIEARKQPEMVRQGEALRAKFMALLNEADPAASELLERDQELVMSYWLRFLESR